MANSETILSANTHPGDSTVTTVTGEKFKGDGYYGRSDGFHTVQYSLSGFIGTVTMQGTLATAPGAADSHGNFYGVSGGAKPKLFLNWGGLSSLNRFWY